MGWHLYTSKDLKTWKQLMLFLENVENEKGEIMREKGEINNTQVGNKNRKRMIMKYRNALMDNTETG